MLSIIIPTLNAAESLPKTLDTIPKNTPVVVVDGGSTDETVTIARTWGAEIITSEPGRGRQLAAGGRAAAGPWLLFLHADTRLPQDALDLAQSFIADPLSQNRAAYFWLSFDDQSRGARRVAHWANIRAHSFGLPYGDQGLLIHKDFYIEVGGFRPQQDLMEDVDLVRRVGPMRLKRMKGAVTTSARRYQTGGWWARPIKNLLCLGLYLAGLPKSWYESFYK